MAVWPIGSVPLVSRGERAILIPGVRLGDTPK